MGILDGLEPPTKTQPCKVRTLLESLDGSDANILAAALDDRETWNANNLAKVLRDRGIDMTSETMRKHMTKACSCSRT